MGHFSSMTLMGTRKKGGRKFLIESLEKKLAESRKRVGRVQRWEDEEKEECELGESRGGGDEVKCFFFLNFFSTYFFFSFEI